jgi:anthranilate/para-aminobenzoate synthase component II
MTKRAEDENIINIFYSNSTYNILERFFKMFELKTAVCIDPKNADLIVLEGGADVNPALYKEKQHTHTSISPASILRDTHEMGIIDIAKQHKIPMLGICRGAQLLCVAAGGKLVQHVVHTFTHNVRTYNSKNITVNSMHHQMMLPVGLQLNLDYIPLGWSDCSNIHQEADGKEIDFNSLGINHKEIEYCYFPKLNALAVQSHPESDTNKDALEFLYEQMIAFGIINIENL